MGGGILSIDLNMSNAMKGVACVMILMGHWGTLTFFSDIPWGISKFVWLFFCNIALFWFMFFSGYGLSIKKYMNNYSIISLWLKRIKKIYLPLLVTCILMTLIYALLPANDSLIYSPQLFNEIHHFSSSNMPSIILQMIGWSDWYVICILYFYTFFYMSLWIGRTLNVCNTYILFGFMSAYLIFAISFYGYENAHYYRYCWVFFLGHIVAKWDNLTSKINAILCCCVLAITLFLENGMRLQNIIIIDIAYFMAFILLIIISIVNRRYEMRGSAILFMGSISYFFYLCHVRIGYFLISYANITDVIIWGVVTIFVASLLLFIQNILCSVSFSQINKIKNLL